MVLLTLLRTIFTGLLIFITSAIVIFKWKERQRRPTRVNGFVKENFEKIREVFTDNLMRGWERDGAAMCVYYKGECVVDLWGGFADKESERDWTKDTLQIIFSSSKAIGAVCIALLTDRGLLKYSDKVSSFWPEFGSKGKEDITIEMIMSHTAGLALIDKKITWEDARDHEKMAKIIENQAPNWVPGSKVGYHVFSYGWLVDQIIRRVDDKHRGCGQFFREEIAQKHGLDIHVGLALEQSWRVARIRRPSIWNRIDEFITDPDNVDYAFIFKEYLLRGIGSKITNNPPWMQTIFTVTLNNPEMYTLEQSAALAISNARELARFAHLLLDGKIISQTALSRLGELVQHQRDIVSNSLTKRSFGTTIVDYERNGKTFKLVGHAGFGGQNIRWDEKNELTIAYISNGLKGGLGDRARTYVRVLDTLFDCLATLDNNNNNSSTTTARLTTTTTSIPTTCRSSASPTCTTKRSIDKSETTRQLISHFPRSALG